MVKISKGLNLPLLGAPDQSRIEQKTCKTAAIVGGDYVGMKPTMAVAEGDAVKRGQLLFDDKKTEGVRYTSPACGKVIAVNRGAKRAFQSVIIEIDGEEQVKYQSYADSDLTTLGRETVRDALLECGLWPALRSRPFSKVADPAVVPHSIFVTAIDTNPLAADPVPLIKERPDEFRYGLQVLRHLTDGPVYLCNRPGSELPGRDFDFVRVGEFDGPHPAGLVGTHIHFLDPVSEKKKVWYLNYSDVLDIGRFFATGELPAERIVAFGGPVVKEPRLLRVPVGANLAEITEGELSSSDDVRLLSGSVFNGRKYREEDGFLGRYHVQVSALEEGHHREFLGWQGPGFEQFSIRRIFASSAVPEKKYAMTTSTHGSPRAMVPIGMYEDVMPLDIEATFFLRALITGDTEQAQLLGALELDEEDVALCTFVDPGKTEYGPLLRDQLTQIEREG
ncbi:Na(+)-translocating NADH-quinone reductase subunit A [Stratiformator vulcanicus]|uniref:Na(+)-translocating NADH-quinone reductase subunit A n=1 Tax=Stratiformator vulcanicus TaxID=2527980 RepID=A0A517QWA3_9PLAN|nr:Na(+)-translocating NADH-quinone reductase subunit A [Stratiformator vulcanicus]QDT35853.1 Na(+)-translocating NADH-quinone reductase subunit A [Stratiformator vulcanicus]